MARSQIIIISVVVEIPTIIIIIMIIIVVVIVVDYTVIIVVVVTVVVVITMITTTSLAPNHFSLQIWVGSRISDCSCIVLFRASRSIGIPPSPGQTRADVLKRESCLVHWEVTVEPFVLLLISLKGTLSSVISCHQHNQIYTRIQMMWQNNYLNFFILTIDR